MQLSFQKLAFAIISVLPGMDLTSFYVLVQEKQGTLGQTVHFLQYFILFFNLESSKVFTVFSRMFLKTYPMTLAMA